MLSEQILTKYKSINLVERFVRISTIYNCNHALDSYEHVKVFEMLKEENQEFKYYKSENFFGIKESLENFEFRLNISLKFGVVETIFFAKNKKNGEQFGGPMTRLAKQIQISDGSTDITKIAYPRFSDYNQLQKIVRDILLIYDDFKCIVIS